MNLKRQPDLKTRISMTKSKDVIYRELLALDRTNLAVDRTLLAYWRTSLTMLIIGISFIKLFNAPILMVLGWLLIPLAIALSIVGMYRCRRLKKRNNGQSRDLSSTHASIQPVGKASTTRRVLPRRKATTRAS